MNIIIIILFLFCFFWVSSTIDPNLSPSKTSIFYGNRTNEGDLRIISITRNLCPQPACQAAYDGDLNQLYNLLKTDPTKLNVQEPGSGETPLTAACRGRKLRVVRYLLDQNADVHLTNKVGFPADVRGSAWRFNVSVCSSETENVSPLHVQVNLHGAGLPDDRHPDAHPAAGIPHHGTASDWRPDGSDPVLLSTSPSLLQLEKKKQSAELMKAVLSSAVNVNAIDYVSVAAE